MIVSFSVSDFRSFAGEETLSLVASNRLSGSHDDHVVSIPDSREKVLKAAVLYGANGAGKSNLFQALSYLRTIALDPRARHSGTGRKSFRFAEVGDGESSFDLHFFTGSALYRYGLRVDDERITEEWLYRVVNGQQKRIYDRTTDKEGQVSVVAEQIGDASDKLRALAKVGGPPNQSFLATVSANLNSADCGEHLAAVLAWFRVGIVLLGPDSNFGPLAQALFEDPDFRTFAGAFLRAAATGVDRLSVARETISDQEMRRLMLGDGQTARRLKRAESNSSFVRLGEGDELLVEVEEPGKAERLRILAVHERPSGEQDELELVEESDGTRRLLNLLPALHMLRRHDAVLFVDEIDRSMHPMLVKEFLRFFLQSCPDGYRQIIVTTHESNLLDQDLLRRDEIWFVEKDREGASHLYSLLDFKVRKDLELRKGYLQGRFGAVPFLGNLCELMDERDSRQ